MAKHSSQRTTPIQAETFPTALVLGLKAFTLTGLTILLVQLFRGSAQSEGPDKAIFLLSIAIAAIFILMGLTKGQFNSGKYFYASGAILITAIGVIGIEEHDPINGVVLSNRLWLGFGPFVFLIMAAIFGFVFKVLEWKSLSKPWKVALAILFSANTALAIPSFWQSAKAVIDADHSEYVINEIIAPLNGYWPYSDFIPQYQTFYGFFLKPFVSSMNASQISDVIYLALTFITYLTIVLGVFIAWLALNRSSLVLAVGLVVPFTALTQFPTREGYLGSIASLLSGLSIRVFPGLLLLMVTIYVLNSHRAQTTKKRFIALAIVGVFSGLVAWQSQDFGLAAAITTILTVAFASSPKLIDFKSVAAVMAGLIPGFLIYPMAGAVSGHPINFDYFLFFARQFGSGFGAERMRTPGPVLVILPLIVLLVVVHAITLHKSKNALEVNAELFNSSLIGLTFSIWSFAGFTYYLNRSYASGQMQILFLTIAVSLAALVGVVVKALDGDLPKGFLLSKTNRNSKNFAWMLTLAIVFSIPFSTLVLTPNPAVELARIDEGSSTPRWPKATILASVEDARAASKFAKANGLKLGFFGASAAYVEKETGVQSLSILNSPFDLGMSQQTIQVSCEYIAKINPDVIVASDEGAALFQFEGKTLCNAYVQRDIPGVRSGHFAVRVGQ
ncbi:hypothetical protein MCEMKE26_01300 [Candidatus Nanopelagicaceae bacterium]